MSGGSFDYAFEKVETFADELNIKLEQEEPYLDLSMGATCKLKEIESASRYLAKLMREVEWLYSGDTEEPEFLRRVKEIEDVKSTDSLPSLMSEIKSCPFCSS